MIVSVGLVKNLNADGGVVEMDKGYIVVDKYMHTSKDGVFACGDIINRNVKQVVTACSDGAIAALEAIKYVNKLK